MPFTALVVALVLAQLAILLATSCGMPSASPMAAGGPTGLPTFSGEKLLDLPPLLDGPRGKMSNSTTGGIIDETLNDWITSNDMWDSLGTWYDITKWAARTRNCDNASTSVVCMACAMNMPAFTVPAHVAPIAVGDELFGSPEKSATCGMCLRVYMPEDYPKCNESRAGHDPHCAGFGTHPYLRYVSKPWAWKARVESDPKLNMSYFTAIIIGTNLCLMRSLTQHKALAPPSSSYKAVPCPVGSNSLGVQFLDFSKPVPNPNIGICNNQYNDPCGNSSVFHLDNPLGTLKLMITGQRIPLSLVQYRYDNNPWISMHRSGDGFWQPDSGWDSTVSPSKPISLNIFCSDGSKPRFATVIPGKALCSYQNPICQSLPIPGVQC